MDGARLAEVSGVAVSRRDSALLWAHNDSGDWPTLYAISTTGKTLGQVDILGARAADWEDIAAFEWRGQPWLLIADTGDNFGIRAQVTLYLLPEPALDQPEAKVARRIDFQYPDGPRDVEAVAVDAADGWIYLLSKRDDPPCLYRLPLLPAVSGDQLLLAQPVTCLKELPGATNQDLRQDPRYGSFRHQPTALDISDDGRRWLITTYKHGLVYQRASGQSLADVFAEKPRIFTLPQLPQIEAGALSRDARMGYFMSEKTPTEVIALPLE